MPLPSAPSRHFMIRDEHRGSFNERCAPAILVSRLALSGDILLAAWAPANHPGRNDGSSDSVAGALARVHSLACGDRRFVGLREPPMLK